MGTTIVLILRKKLKGNFAVCAIFFAVLQKGIGGRHSGIGGKETNGTQFCLLMMK